MRTYTFYNDPGHAWLKVSRQECIDLGIINKISGFSYQRGENLYLEEDCDAPLFLQVKSNTLKNGAYKIKDLYSNRLSKIRNYERVK